MTDLNPQLTRLGVALHESAAVELGAARRPKRRLAIAAIALAILIPSVAFAADRLISIDQVATSMPAGTLALAGTEPTCTTVKEGVEYHCVLAKAPAPEVSDWKGTVEATVDQTKHVNGGCRSLNSGGTEWECYIGQAAVDQQIVSQSFLGQESFGPAAG